MPYYTLTELKLWALVWAIFGFVRREREKKGAEEEEEEDTIPQGVKEEEEEWQKCN